jgi:sugar lactone lactonase YvrE
MISAISFHQMGKPYLQVQWIKLPGSGIFWKYDSNFKGHEGSNNSVAFSPDERLYLVRGIKPSGTEPGRTVCFPCPDGDVNSVGFSPDGESIFIGSQDKTVRLLDLQGNVLQVFKGNERYVSSVVFSPDGKNLLTVSSAIGLNMQGAEDNTACLWDLRGNQLQLFKGHEGSINSVAFSPDGNMILTGSWDKTARLWEIKKTHKKFSTGNSYQDLSIAQKIKYGIPEN